MAWKFSFIVFIISTELLAVALSQTYCAEEEFNPICGDDGRTYDNACELEDHNSRNDYEIGKAYHGECRDEGNYDDSYGTYKKKEEKKVVVIVHSAPAPYAPAPAPYAPAPAPYAPAPAPYAPAPAPYAPAPAPYAPAPAPYAPAPAPYAPAPAPYAPAPAPYAPAPAPVVYVQPPVMPMMMSPTSQMGIGPIMPIPVPMTMPMTMPISPNPMMVPRPVFRSELEELVPVV